MTPGDVVGNYRVLEQLSVGGMGTIFRAQHALIGRLAAIKVLHGELSTNRDIVNRFFNEAKATSSIKHPGIVEIFDFGYMESGFAYIVMELLDGMTLSQRAKVRGPMPEAEAALYLRGVCSALAAAHALGIVHRDLKPDNVFLVPDLESPVGERVKLLDFGIAKLTELGAAGTATKTGAVMGTPTYMSPEQCRGTGEVDHRADLYSIGCMFYELVSGRPPFVQLGAGELIGSHLYLAPEPLAQHAQVSAETNALVMSLLEKAPERRVQSARELVEILSGIAQRGHVARPSLPPFQGPVAVAHDSLPPTVIAPTTLSGAASVVLPPARRSRAGIAIGMGLVAAIAVIAIAATRGADPDAPVARPAALVQPPPARRPAPPPPPPSPRPPVTAPAAAPAEITPLPAEPVKPAKPAKPAKVTKPRPRPSSEPLLETDL